MSRGKHPGGRPKVWTPERVSEHGRNLLVWMTESESRYWLKGYAIEQGFPAQNLSEWAADPVAYPEFSESYKRAKDIQERRLVELGLTMRNPTMVVFALKNVAGWRDVQSNEHSGPNNGPIQHEATITVKQAADEFDALLGRAIDRRATGAPDSIPGGEGGSAV